MGINTADYFMKIAEIVKLRSDCQRRQVGAVYVLDSRIVATGYNQAPSKIKHCNEVGCFMKDNHCIRAIHGEINGILNATIAGQTLLNSTLYVTSFPCLRCLMELRNARISEIIYKEPYEYSKEEKQLLDELFPHFRIQRYIL